MHRTTYYDALVRLLKFEKVNDDFSTRESHRVNPIWKELKSSHRGQLAAIKPMMQIDSECGNA